MSSKIYPFRKSNQIKTYIGQFMRIFSGFQVQDGVNRNGSVGPTTKRVPVIFGAMDRVIAARFTNRDWKNAGSLPLISVSLTGLEPDPARNYSAFHKDEGIDSETSTHGSRIIGPAFIMRMDVNIWSDSITELLELVEQILLIFHPRITIQKSSDIFDHSYLTEVSLDSIQSEISFPISTETRVVMQTLSFTVPIRLNYPYQRDSSVIEQIILNVKDGDSKETYFEEIIPEEVEEDDND